MKLSMGIDMHNCFIYGGSTPSTGSVRFDSGLRGLFKTRGKWELDMKESSDFPFD